MLTIRLSRVGKKNKPMYRLIISEKTRDPYGRSLEILGSYNPYTKELNVKADRIKYWLSQGSGMSATVNNLLIENKIIEGKKVKASISRDKKKGKEEDKKKVEVKSEKSEDAKTEEKAEDKPADAENEAKPKEKSVEAEKPAEEAKPEEKIEDKPAEEKPIEEKKEEPKKNS